MTVNLYELSFYASIFFVLLGAVLGLLGVWVHDFWKDETTWKLFLTDCILSTASVIVAVITRFLSH